MIVNCIHFNPNSPVTISMVKSNIPHCDKQLNKEYYDVFIDGRIAKNEVVQFSSFKTSRVKAINVCGAREIKITTQDCEYLMQF